jgi:hypothetical protein
MTDFKFFRPSVDYTKETLLYTNAGIVFIRNYWKCFNVGVGLPVFGLIYLYKKTSKMILLTFLSSVLLSAIFLVHANLASKEDLVSIAYVERYSIAVALLLAILAGAGVGLIQHKNEVSNNLVNPLHLIMSIIILGALYTRGHDLSDASKEPTLDLFREGLALSSDPNAYYFAGTDLELFYGFPTLSGMHEIRFPICADYNWSKRVIPIVEPRLKNNVKSNFENDRVSVQLAKSIYEQGNRIMISQPNILNGAPKTPVQKGLFWFLQSSTQTISLREIAETFGKLCSIVEKFYHPRPTQGFNYPRSIFAMFPASYRNASKYFQIGGQTQLSNLALEIAQSLEKGDRPEKWHKSCTLFKNRIAEIYFD